MKYKILSIIICFMLLTTVFAFAKNIDEINTKDKKIETLPLSFDDDVPTWDDGDSWTYTIDSVEFTLDEISNDFSMIFNMQIGELTIDIVDDTGDYYTGAILETDITGDYEIVTDLGDGPIEITGAFEETKLTGSIEFDKSNIGMTEFDMTLDGKLTVNIVEQPYFERNIFPQVPIPATIELEIGMDPALTLLSFPINSTFFVYGLPALNISFGGTLESIWLRIFNFLNNAIRKWQLIGPISRLLQVPEAEFQEMSDMIYDILPIIDIKHVLNEYLEANNYINTPELEYLFYCNETVPEITVAAGTFYDVYKIDILGGLGTIYYSPVVENIIKMEGNFEEVIPFINNIDIELSAYS